ncbi:MAG: folylpolyglutamate synthase/dihydrofolate synthase family protein [Candidatus Omnitrophota bacterium]
MIYEDAVAYLETFIDYEKKSSFDVKTAFKFDRIKKFLSLIGDPQKALSVIHVAGTKGKGSTACFIANILKEAGFRTGLYTSPHLADFRERIRIFDSTNTAEEKMAFGGMILKQDLVDILVSLESFLDSFAQDHPDLGPLTFFEVVTAVAFKYFRDKNVDFAVLETGLGGRFDATNAADSMVTVITPISYDHEQFLGTTLSEIAFEKAGIIKATNRRTPDGVSVCVNALQAKPVTEVLRRRFKSETATVFQAGRDFCCKKLAGDLFSQDFFYQGLTGEPLFLKTRMLGTHQIANASLGLAACEALSLFGVKIKGEAMVRGILKTFWPGRLEVVHTKPFIILDGAHNADSAKRLGDFLNKEFKKFHKWFILGASEDKNIKAIVESLEPLADRIILTRSKNPRAADPKGILQSYFHKKNFILTDSVEEAVGILNKEIKPDDVAVVTGSLFVVGEARSLWQG